MIDLKTVIREFLYPATKTVLAVRHPVESAAEWVRNDKVRFGNEIGITLLKCCQ